MKISELMSKVALVVQSDVSVARMAQLFAKHQISGAPVIDHEGHLVGVVSLSDLAKSSKAAQKHHADYYLNASWGDVHWHHDEAETLKVSDIMTHTIISAEVDDDIERAADLLVNHGIHRVVITRGKQVAGVITTSDLVKEFRRRLRSEKEAPVGE